MPAHGSSESMKIFFSVGEPSGDIHGANLIRDLQRASPGFECAGLGGQRMASAGCQLMEDLASRAVMGIIPVLKEIRFFWDLLKRVDQFLESYRPDAVVLIDYPGFNWWVARKAKKYGIPVFYYGVPQMWGWAPWRVHKMKRLIDHALCKLPFEEKWYGKRGCPAKYVGHPFFDEVSRQELDQEFMNQFDDEQPFVLLLPGSRTQEVKVHLEPLLKAADSVNSQRPEVRFAIGCVNEKHSRMANELIGSMGLRIDTFIAKTPELIRLSDACIACSGSVSLELMASNKPTVIVYKITRGSWFLQSILRRAKFITLVNLLSVDDIERDRWATYDPSRSGADWIPYPEYLTVRDQPESMARHIVDWLDDSECRERVVDCLKDLNQRYGQPGASVNAAKFIFDTIDGASAEHEERRDGTELSVTNEVNASSRAA